MRYIFFALGRRVSAQALSAREGAATARTRAMPAAAPPQAALLRAYLLEHAEALYADRTGRLSARGVSEAELDTAERLWVLRALDEHWQRHISAMAVLRNSVNLRAFGLLEPLEEYNIDGARAFAQLVDAVRRRAVQYMFYFVDVTAPGGDEPGGDDAEAPPGEADAGA